MSPSRLASPRLRSAHPGDAAAQSAILTAICRGSAALAVAATGIVLAKGIAHGPSYLAAHLPTVAIAAAVFLALAWLASRLPVLVSSLVILMFLGLGLMTLARWSIFFPTGWLVCVLAIVIAAVLLGTRAALVAALLTGLGLVGITYAEIRQSTPLDLHWTQQLSWGDLAASLLILIFILILSGLAARESERSLERALRSEEELRRQRDRLEEMVEERTRQLRQTQREETLRLYEFAEFGRLSSNLLHDLVTPLSTISHTLKRLDAGGPSEQLLRRALDTTDRLERFIAANRKQARRQQAPSNFVFADEVREAADVFDRRVREVRAQLELDLDPALSGHGDPIKFYRLVCNLLSNALDACAEAPGRPARINVRLFREGASVRLQVSDTGIGIPKGDLGKIFDPLFTTKGAKGGTGIGLSICKEIVEQDFGGSIVVRSAKGETKVEVQLPIPKLPPHASNRPPAAAAPGGSQAPRRRPAA